MNKAPITAAPAANIKTLINIAVSSMTRIKTLINIAVSYDLMIAQILRNRRNDHVKHAKFYAYHVVFSQEK